MPTRSCNGCKACCFTHVVHVQTSTELTIVTGPFSHCRYECAKGCRIYKNKPQSCEDYSCAWLQGKVDGPRPDEIGLVVDFTKFLNNYDVCSVMEAKPGAVKSKAGREYIRKLCNQHIVVVARISSRTLMVMGPSDRYEAMVKIQGEINAAIGLSANLPR